MNRINLICLGVRDMSRSIKFYRDGLGFKTSEKGDSADIVFFDNAGSKFELYPLNLLAEDIDKDNPPAIGAGFSGVTLAFVAKSKEEVDQVMERASKAGGRIAKRPQDVFWGGYSGYFQDPDGYYWEVAWGPKFAFDEADMLVFS